MACQSIEGYRQRKQIKLKTPLIEKLTGRIFGKSNQRKKPVKGDK